MRLFFIHLPFLVIIELVRVPASRSLGTMQLIKCLSARARDMIAALDVGYDVVGRCRASRREAGRWSNEQLGRLQVEQEVGRLAAAVRRDTIRYTSVAPHP